MTKISFADMSLTPKVARAIDEMGFDTATPIQSQAIPVIRSGVDVIARSQTGTGKTIAFAIPAIERVDTHEEKPTIQVLVLCPTRELAMQADEEFRKLARFKPGIRPVAIYGGTPIDKQRIALRRANIVVGTPGRVMDHMRRKSIKLHSLKMLVLDEADEMLNMGFKEDIETILSDTPDTRQTVFFSATMPPAIMKITKEFQKDPQLIEIDKKQVTLDNIEQSYVDVPHSAKRDALVVLLQYYKPGRAIVFCATKKMADELTELLAQHDMAAACIHSDIKQTQRTSVMREFKAGKTQVLIATDIAARGIDVNDVECVINFDLPPNSEYYVHRIGRTGRAGKPGSSITICGTRRESMELRRIAHVIKAELKELPMPTAKAVAQRAGARLSEALEEKLLAQQGTDDTYAELVQALLEKGHSAEQIAAAALALHDTGAGKISLEAFGSFAAGKHSADTRGAAPQKARRDAGGQGFSTMLIDIGRESRVSANHIVGAVTERAGVSGREIGRVEILEDHCLVGVATAQAQEIVQAMQGCKICGKATQSRLLELPQGRQGGSAKPQSRGAKPGAKKASTNRFMARGRVLHGKKH